MSHSCAQWRGDIGAYIVGALDARARYSVARHLAACSGCRADYDELVPVREWLALVPLTAGEPEPGPAEQAGRPFRNAMQESPDPAARPGGVVPPPRRGSDTEFPARSADKLQASRPRTQGRLPAAGAAIVAAAATAVALLVASAASAHTFRAADSATGVTGRAQLHGTPTGTQIDLTASGLPGHERCILVAVTHGSTDIAGSWNATYDGSGRMDGTTAFPASQLTALRIESDTGNLLLSIRV